MKRLIELVVAIACLSAMTVGSNASDESAEKRTNELADTLRLLNERPKGAPAEGPDLDRPGWRNTAVLAKLQNIANTYTNTDEALTAELWLTIVRLDSTQSITDSQAMRNASIPLEIAFRKIIDARPNSWQAKAARIGRSLALFHARKWDSLSSQVTEITNEIQSYNVEANENYLGFLEANSLNPQDVEPELRFLILVGAALQGPSEKAISMAKDLQRRFPKWSERTKIKGIIEQLEAGKIPFRIP